MRLFLDTNVLLDAFLERELSAAPRWLLNNVSDGNFIAYVSGISIATATYFLEKAFRQDTRRVIEVLLQAVEIITLEKEDFHASLHSPVKDLEDAYQVTAAKKVARLDYLITRNRKDFKSSGLSILTPEALLGLIVK